MIRRFLLLLNSSVRYFLDRNDQEATNLSFVLPGLHLNILNTEKMLRLDKAKDSRSSARGQHLSVGENFYKTDEGCNRSIYNSFRVVSQIFIKYTNKCVSFIVL